jgi:endoglucanase
MFWLRVLPLFTLLSGCVLCARAAAPPGRIELRNAWQDYSVAFIQEDGRVVDRAGGGMTTSEGQSYGMLRAVWMDDRPTFDRVRQWTAANLQGGDLNKLPSWQWGQRADGTWGTLDENPASDADIMIAYALLLGAQRWQDPTLSAQALALLEQVWTTETQLVGEHRVLLPGPWAAGKPFIQINPSYSMPFAFRVFAILDPSHPWQSLVDDTYWMLETVSRVDGLPPDWAWIDAETGELMPPPEGEGDKAGFGFEAFRVAWFMAAELKWYDEARARTVLDRMDTLRTRWQRDGSIPAVIRPDGSAGRTYDYLGLYGALLPAWGLLSPTDAESLYT